LQKEQFVSLGILLRSSCAFLIEKTHLERLGHLGVKEKIKHKGHGKKSTKMSHSFLFNFFKT